MIFWFSNTVTFKISYIPIRATVPIGIPPSENNKYQVIKLT